MSKILEFKNKDKVKGSFEYKNVTEKSCDLYMYGDIVSDEWGKCNDTDVCPQDVMDFLNELEGKEECHIYMNSGGGSVFAGIAIANLLKRKECNIICHIDALCASIATVIATGCNEVRIHANSTFMIHKPMSCFFLDMLNAAELRKEAEVLDSIQKSILVNYMDFAKEGVTEEQINDYINKETWFTGKEACEIFNFVLEDSKEMVACVSDIFSNAKNCPIKDKEESQTEAQTEAIVDMDNMVDELAEKVAEKLREKETEERKNAILKRIGKKED